MALFLSGQERYRPSAARAQKSGERCLSVRFAPENCKDLSAQFSKKMERTEAYSVASVEMRLLSQNPKAKMSRVLVLIVEDDALIRLHAALIIEDAGHDVIEASTADEAVALLEARNDIGMIFTDVNMPGSMDGIKLAHAVYRRWPPIKIIVTSGKEFPTVDELPEGSCFLPKPYMPHHVANAMRSLFADMP